MNTHKILHHIPSGFHFLHHNNHRELHNIDSLKHNGFLVTTVYSRFQDSDSNSVIDSIEELIDGIAQRNGIERGIERGLGSQKIVTPGFGF